MEDLEGTLCAVLFLEAHDPSTAYAFRKLWVDPQRKIVLREEMYAKSKKMLKTVAFLDYATFGKRLFPKTMVFRDLLKGDSKTTYRFDEIRFDIEIPEQYFQMSILKR
jgi:outer membrane lipoprotein-sorting protein